MLNPSTGDEIKECIISAIRRIAPEVDPQAINPDLPLRDQVDLDSMDFLTLVVNVHEKLGVDIPESDYSQLGTLRGFISYVMKRLSIPCP